MGLSTDDAASVTSPIEGKITVTAVTAATATAAIDTGELSSSYYTFCCDDGAGAPVNFYITFGQNDVTAMAAPDPTSVAGADRTFGPYAGKVDIKVTGHFRFYRVWPKSTGYFRHYKSSQGGSP